ncbi:MAG: hypothetical protein OEY28_09540 [Nitrospira sp.]|nr:hypothetical protein [Nitrospira sp.]
MLGKTLLLGAALGLGYAIWRHLRTSSASSAQPTTDQRTPKTPKTPKIPNGDIPAASAEITATTSAQANEVTHTWSEGDEAAELTGTAPVANTPPPPMRELAIIRRLWRELGAWIGTPAAERRPVIMCRTCGGPMIQIRHQSRSHST